MQSIIKPLANKVAIFNSHIGNIVRGLNMGDPAAIKQTQDLWKDISNFYQECSSGYSQVNASWNNSIATAAGSYNPTTMAGMIAYYIGEVFAALQLIINLMKFVASLVSITTILEILNSDLLKAQQYLNTQLLWLTRSVARAKQKLTKNIEWQQKIITAELDIVYQTSQQTSYQTTLNQLNAQLPSAPTPNAGIGGNGTYINGTFVYFTSVSTTPSLSASANSLLVSSTNEAAISAANSAVSGSNTPATNNMQDQINAITAHLVIINKQIQANQYELKVAIPADQKFWKDMWIAQEKQDQTDLLKNVSKIGVNV